MGVKIPDSVTMTLSPLTFLMRSNVVCKETSNVFRLRLLIEILKNKLGGSSKGNWALHVKNFKNDGWVYLSWKNFPHHCTDGPDCYIAKIYYQSEIKEMLKKSGFKVEKMKKGHFPIGGHFPKLERFLAKYIGFHQLVWAKKS